MIPRLLLTASWLALVGMLAGGCSDSFRACAEACGVRGVRRATLGPCECGTPATTSDGGAR